jgi:hypothetical protein
MNTRIKSDDDDDDDDDDIRGLQLLSIELGMVMDSMLLHFTCNFPITAPRYDFIRSPTLCERSTYRDTDMYEASASWKYSHVLIREALLLA